MKNKTVVTEYKIGKGARRLRMAVAADLHNSPYDNVLPLIEAARPDIIVVPGDLCGSLADCDEAEGNLTSRYIRESQHNHVGFDFIREAGSIAPVYCSVGNHEVRVSESNRAKYAEAGAVLLDDSYVSLGDITLGGLTSGGAHGLWHKSDPPNLEWLDSFAALDGFKILLCHHPEYWRRHIIGKNIALTVSGHAHGGQWRFLGQGVFAPGQGLLPRYTSGVYRRDGRYMVVSRGLRQDTEVPRINNPLHVVVADVCI